MKLLIYDRRYQNGFGAKSPMWIVVTGIAWPHISFRGGDFDFIGIGGTYGYLDGVDWIELCRKTATL